MTLLRETDKDHGLLLDHDPKGMRRISITLAGRTPKRNGRRIQNAVGDHYDRCFQPTSTVLWKMQGKRLQPQDVEARQYYPISEEEAVQIRALDGRSGICRRHPGSRIPGPSHRGHAPVRELLVVRLRPEQKSPPEGHRSTDSDVRMRAYANRRPNNVTDTLAISSSGHSSHSLGTQFARSAPDLPLQTKSDSIHRDRSEYENRP